MKGLRLAHWFFLGRAIARGPRYFTAYELNRQIRRLGYRATRGLYGKRR